MRFIKFIIHSLCSDSLQYYSFIITKLKFIETNI